jgi:hypothetical protein
MFRRSFRCCAVVLAFLTALSLVAPATAQNSQTPANRIRTTVEVGWKVEVRKPGSAGWAVSGRFARMDHAKAEVADLYRLGFEVRLTKIQALTFHRPNATAVQPTPGAPSAVTWSHAVAIFRQMEAMGDRIAFRFPTDGCYARAHLMAQQMKRMGQTSWKVWSKANGREPLFAATSNHPRGYVTWSWHVAPILRVRLSTGKVIWCVFDPSLFSRPSSLGEWQRAQKRPAATVSPLIEITPPGRAPLWEGKRVGNGYTVSDTIPAQRLDQVSWAKMRQYKPFQGKWHPKLDKDAPNRVKTRSGTPERTSVRRDTTTLARKSFSSRKTKSPSAYVSRPSTPIKAALVF